MFLETLFDLDSKTDRVINPGIFAKMYSDLYANRFNKSVSATFSN